MNNFVEQRLLRLLIILLPFHYFIFSILLKDYGVLKYWKEIVVIITFIIIFTKKMSIVLKYKQCNLTLLDVSIVYFLLPVIFSFLVLTDNKVDGLYMIRVYFQPLLVYYIVRNISMTESQFNKFIKIIFNISIILAVYGVLQAIVLGDQFLINLGYPTKYDGRLGDPFYISGFENFQRVVSTFVNPNTCAIYLSFSLILVFMNSHIFTKRKLAYGITLILIAILFTFSRSAWIPLFFVLIIIIRFLKKTFPSLKKTLILLPLFFVLFLLLFSTLFDLNIFEKLYSFIYRSITLEDTSAAGRSHIWNQAISIIKDNIYGIGMGHTGAKAAVLGNDKISSESSYLTILLDFGIQGFVPFLLMFISSLYVSLNNLNKFKNYNKLKIINIGCLLATMMILISMLFSNYIHDIELFSLFYVIIGLGSNKYLYQSIINSETNCG